MSDTIVLEEQYEHAVMFGEESKIKELEFRRQLLWRAAIPHLLRGHHFVVQLVETDRHGENPWQRTTLTTLRLTLTPIPPDGAVLLDGRITRVERRSG